jgi:hypothetical protein
MSGLPLIKLDDKYLAESFVDSNGKLDANYKDRLFNIEKRFASNECAICPEFELR